MPVVCQFDQSTHESTEALHAYLRRFRMKQQIYYHQFYPRYDKLTGELIPYKDYEQYHSAEFVSKENLKKWLGHNRAEGFRWSVEWLKKRKIDKSLTYAPSQAELRTLMCPSMPYYDSLGGDQGGYYGITDQLGYATRYLSVDPVFIPLARDTIIIQDSREQRPLKFQLPTVKETLKVGDYALAAPHDCGIRIERKSLSDFCGTLSGRTLVSTTKIQPPKANSAFARFDRELARAVKDNLYVIMMVEADINEAQLFGHLPQTRHVKASASYIFHQLRELLTKYPLSFQVVFVNGRVEMVSKMLRIFQLGQQVRQLDLEHLHERGGL